MYAKDRSCAQDDESKQAHNEFEPIRKAILEH